MRHFFAPLFLLSATLLCAAQLYAQTLGDVVVNGDFKRGLSDWTHTDTGRFSVVEANIGGATRALRVEVVTNPDDKPWSVQLRQKLEPSWKEGELIRLAAWMRSPQSLKVRPIVEASATDDFAKSLSKEVALSPEWTKVEVDGAALKDYKAGALTLGFQLAYGTGTVEMTAIQLQKPLPAAVTTKPNGARLDAPQSLIRNGDFAEALGGSWIFSDKTPTATLVDVAGQGFKQALQLEVAQATEHPWDARAATPKIGLPLTKGSLIGVRFWARSPQQAQLGVRFQKSEAPFDKIISRNIALTPEWTEYRYYANLASDLPPDATQFEFHVGYGAGTIEVANVRVEDFGPGQVKELELKLGAQSVNFWPGQTDTAWKIAAFERIERYRKGDLKLRVVNDRGKPIPGANVKLVQTHQLFRWGSAVSAARLLNTQNLDNARYRDEVKRLYNTVVFENDLKWMNDEKRAQQALEAARWLRANNIAIRGHNLVWGSRRFLPKIVADNWDDTEKVRQLVRDRVREAATQWKGQLYVWDVANEAVTNTELWDKLGWDEFAQVFKIAREADPNVRLAYNDFNIANEAENPTRNARHRARVVELIRLLREKGAPIDILGDQAHIGGVLTAPARVAAIWSEMAKLGLPLEITEFDAAIPDDAVHAEYVRDILITAFAEPSIESFVMWGFWEGLHWRAGEGGALFRRDWTPRPAQLAYEDLVLKQWRTNVTLRTDNNGVLQTRGFLGDYDVTISTNGQSKTFKMSLPKNGAKRQVVL